MNITGTQQPLFTPVHMGKLELPNRIVMAPLTRMRAANPGRVPSELHAEYYPQRASAGLIIGECNEISPDAYGWADTPGLWSADQVRGWRGVTNCETLHVDPEGIRPKTQGIRDNSLAIRGKSSHVVHRLRGKQILKGTFLRSEKCAASD